MRKVKKRMIIKQVMYEVGVVSKCKAGKNKVKNAALYRSM